MKLVLDSGDAFYHLPAPYVLLRSRHVDRRTKHTDTAARLANSMSRATAKPLIISVTGFVTLLVLILWAISFEELNQLEHYGERPLSLPPFGYILHALYHFSWLLPFFATIGGVRLLRHEEPSNTAVARYCGYFVLAVCLWAFFAIIGLYSLYAMHHHVLG